MDDLFPSDLVVRFEPTRDAGLKRLKAFTPAMGGRYANERNADHGPDDRTNVSALSPWVRTRTLLEEELARAALGKFAFSTAEKFHQEVCWRTYFKGWMEHRPGVWRSYEDERDRQLELLERNAGLRKAYTEAVEGRTGIEGFDDWAKELVETGYLHNHARMWFASIWLFTLNLPLELGADFFLRHLMDGDAASNTCSWRWVGGLHTQGKTYLARRSNISKYTDGRFSPSGLASEAPPLDGPQNPSPGYLLGSDVAPTGEIGLLLTEEDVHVESLVPAGATAKALAGVSFHDDRSPLGAGTKAAEFAAGALDDALNRGSEAFGVSGHRLPAGDDFVEATLTWARENDVSTVVTGFAPMGWVRPRLTALQTALIEDGRELRQLQRPWDTTFWPHAKKGFFGLKKQIQSVYGELGLPV